MIGQKYGESALADVAGIRRSGALTHFPRPGPPGPRAGERSCPGSGSGGWHARSHRRSVRAAAAGPISAGACPVGAIVLPERGIEGLVRKQERAPCRGGRRDRREQRHAETLDVPGAPSFGCGTAEERTAQPACGVRSLAPGCGHARLRPGEAVRTGPGPVPLRPGGGYRARNCSGRRFRPRGTSLSCRKVLTIKEISQCEEALSPPVSLPLAALF